MKANDEVKNILMNDWDPIGIKANAKAKAEYDQYALRIVGMLYNGTTLDKLVKYLDSVVTEDLGLPSNRNKSIEVSKKLLAINL
ncbi:MAG: hypothetical protein J7501_04360 [Bdellovibrio sp.]|nr:hypothetical protein [Bdellovibrio sp.]